jgi:hypothetical protein
MVRVRNRTKKCQMLAWRAAPTISPASSPYPTNPHLSLVISFPTLTCLTLSSASLFSFGLKVVLSSLPHPSKSSTLLPHPCLFSPAPSLHLPTCGLSLCFSLPSLTQFCLPSLCSLPPLQSPLRSLCFLSPPLFWFTLCLHLHPLPVDLFIHGILPSCLPRPQVFLTTSL